MSIEFIQANRYKFFTIGAIGTFMGTLDASILNVALPTIADDLNCTVNVVAWVVLAYSLTLVSLLMVFGAWTERKGYAFAYKFGYVLFIVGSLICALSGTIAMLVFGRVVQATGSAMFQAIGTGMVATVFPRRERGKGIGLMVMMVSAGLMAGPPLGGFMLEIWPWPSIFYLNLPIGLVGLILCFRYFKDFPVPENAPKMRTGGVLALSVGLLTAMVGLSLLSDHPLTDYRIVGSWMVSALAFLMFFILESKPERAIIGLDLFRNRQFSTSIAAMLLLFVSISGVLILVPFFLQNVKNLPPRTVGLFLTLLPVTMFVCAPLSGRLSDKIGYRLLTTTGMLTLSIGLWLLLGLEADSSNSYIAGSLVLVGIGSGIFNTPNSSAAMGSAKDTKRAVVSGIISTTRVIGMGLGVALSTALFSYFQAQHSVEVTESAAFVSSYHKVTYISLALVIGGTLLCLMRKNRLD